MALQLTAIDDPQVRQRTHEARADVNNSNQIHRGDVHVHIISKKRQEKVAKVIVDRLLLPATSGLIEGAAEHSL